MEKPLDQKSFIEKLKDKTETERLALEQIMKAELERLASGLKKESDAVLTTTVTAIKRDADVLARETQQMLQEQTAQVEALKRRWRMTLIGPVVVGLSLFLGISGGAWALMRYQSQEILRQQAVLSELEAKGGKSMVTVCGETRRLCVKIEPKAPEYQGGYRILSGY